MCPAPQDKGSYADSSPSQRLSGPSLTPGDKEAPRTSPRPPTGTKPALAEDSSAGAVWAYEEDLERWAELLCRHRQDAEDVAHAALVKAVEHLGGFRSEAALRTWLHRITTNECAMLRRHRPTASLDELDSARWVDRNAGSAPREDPEAAALEEVERGAVLAAIGGLPFRERLIMLLVAGEGFSADEIARRSGLSVSAVRSLLYRARRRVREEARLTGPGRTRMN